MSEIAVINAATTISHAPIRTDRLVLAPAVPAQTDQVELSDAGQILSKISDSTPARAEKIAQIQREIQAGTYETPERIDGTVDRLMSVLNLD